MSQADSVESLVERARKQDHAAFRALVERYQGKVMAVALSVVRDHEDALDVCQEAFVRAYHGLPNFDGGSQFFTWLYRITHNLAIDHLRKNRRVETVLLDENLKAEDGVDINPLRRLSNRRLHDRILQALDQLSEPQRSVLILREVQGLSYKQIAEVVGCSMGTVMSRLFHARKNLQEQLAEEREGMELELAA